MRTCFARAASAEAARTPPRTRGTRASASADCASQKLRGTLASRWRSPTKAAAEVRASREIWSTALQSQPGDARGAPRETARDSIATHAAEGPRGISRGVHAAQHR